MAAHIQSISVAALTLAGFMVLGTPSTAAQHDPAEAVFRAARTYTVRVRTEIATPFAEDSRGSFQGAGFVVDAKRGWILTNAHVVGQSPSTIHVAFVDGRWIPARKVYVDSFTDMAVLAIDAAPGSLHHATLDGSESPTVGENVGAFGHPLGLLFTGSRGIVSGRTDQFGSDLIQIDATVDHGNSGGPVIRLRDGVVVGIATAGASGQKTDRVNFATPLKDVCRILDLLAQGADATPRQLPFGLLVDEDGSRTLQVARSFDPERWPLEPMDRIVSLAGDPTPLKTVSDLVTGLRGCKGDVPIVVERGGVRVEVVTRPGPAPSILDRKGLLLDGALISPTSINDGAMLNDPPPFTIQSIEPGSSAQALELNSGDMIDKVDGRRFDTLDSLATYLGNRSKGTPVRFLLRRWSPSYHNAFDYLVRDLPADEMRWVGIDTPVASREARQ